jgi:hypothetical protein
MLTMRIKIIKCFQKVHNIYVVMSIETDLEKIIQTIEIRQNLKFGTSWQNNIGIKLRFKKVLLTPLGGVGCHNKLCQKISLQKSPTLSICIGSNLVPVASYKKLLFAPPGGAVCKY